uniref:Uncharacterized protein n=1 Tax=Caenorhabditis japonica TaxID=281687 RepID=A0A8R1EDN4_CAEJA
MNQFELSWPYVYFYSSFDSLPLVVSHVHTCVSHYSYADQRKAFSHVPSIFNIQRKSTKLMLSAEIVHNRERRRHVIRVESNKTRRKFDTLDR